jgi:cytochrome c oxidase subunit II
MPRVGAARGVAVTLSAASLPLGGCAGAPSALEPRGIRAAAIADLWWIMLAVATVVYVVVIALLLVALFRPRSEPVGGSRRRGVAARATARLSSFAGMALVVGGGVVLPVVVLVPLSILTLRVLGAQAAPTTPPTLTVDVIGYQFWWEVRYPDRQIVTANEIPVPVGQPVRLNLTSADVIHSFWVPELMGKLDLIPGRTNSTWLQADRAGVYWGECAEFCGIQHAKMAFLVVAEPPEQFGGWLEQQARPAVEPADSLALRGAQVFARDGCITCHAIRYGTGTVGGQVGPDLTHVGSRLTIAAGILENNRGNLGGWIANPQALKRGNKMPLTYLDSESLLAVVAYLESLE